MKKILFSLGVIGVAAALVAGATGAFFSDTETSTGNTFTAGAIDLKVDSTTHYNHMVCTNTGDSESPVYTWQPEEGFVPQDGQYPAQGSPCTGKTWTMKDLIPTEDKFFDFADIKPGDSGENTVSLHVLNNDAWVCADVSNLTNYENGQTEPEATVDSTTGTNEGELQGALSFTVWRDDGVGENHAGKCDNVWEEGEQVLTSGHPTNGVLPVFDSTTDTGPLKGDSDSCLGVSWSLPANSGNETQTDGLTGDIGLQVVQSRNNLNFSCVNQEVPTQQ